MKSEISGSQLANHLPLFLIFLSLSLSCNQQSPQTDDSTLAIIGDRVIEKQDFSKRFKQLRQRFGIPDDGQSRRQLFKNFVEEAVLITEAKKRGYDDDSEGKYEYERIRIQELLNSFYRVFIGRKVKVSDDELRELFVRLNTRIKARHLYAPTRRKADSLYQALQHGATFGELAKQVFQDPVLRESGGLLGYFTVDDMDPAFEEAAYSLKEGNISKPVHTNDGYSIIRVEERVVKPIITEYEFAKQRTKLKSYWLKRKGEKAAKEYLDSLRRSLQVTFREPIIKKLFTVLTENKDQHKTVESLINASDIERLKKQALVYSELGSWDVAKFQKLAQFTSPEQQSWIRNEENLKDFIAGLVMRSYMLKKARQAGLDNNEKFRQRVSQKFDRYLFERMEEELYQSMSIPEDSARKYYNQDPARFVIPPRIRLREIVSKQKSESEAIASQLNNGASFTKLAKKYSERSWSAVKGGDLGYLTPQDLGKWSEKLMELDTGERIGPLYMDSMYVILECTGKITSRIPGFEEAREEVEKALKAQLWNQFRAKKISEFRKRFNVREFPEKLKTIRIN